MSNHKLANLQLAIMNVLWDRKEATIGDVLKSIAHDRPLAYTTVGTMLSRMEQNGQVTHRVENRVNVYRAKLPREKVSRSMISDLAQRLCAGDIPQVVCYGKESIDPRFAHISVLHKPVSRDVLTNVLMGSGGVETPLKLRAR